jgi:arabinose-5-phosphate isomerase
VELLHETSGRVILSGVGKSGIVARKIAATLTSTGTAAAFLHPVESQHGDLGLVSAADVAILVSKSGDSDELLTLLEQLKRLGVRTIALVGDARSPLAKHSDVSIDASVGEEACPHNLAPTTSTTVALALGDALAVALLQLKGFKAEDFARLHPGGRLGRKLLTRVSDVMISDAIPVLPLTATMREAIVQLAERRGIVMIVDAERQLRGVVTTGDLTRAMERMDDILGVPVGEVMNENPRSCSAAELGSAAVFHMEKFGIIAMPVLGERGEIAGVVHLHDLMRAGVV